MYSCFFFCFVIKKLVYFLANMEELAALIRTFEDINTFLFVRFFYLSDRQCLNKLKKNESIHRHKLQYFLRIISYAAAIYKLYEHTDMHMYITSERRQWVT